MSSPATRSAEYKDLFDLPDNLVGEIIHGTLHTHPRPRPPHALATSILGMDIGTPFQRGRGGPGGWWILTEPELHLDAHVLVPDLAGWRRQRLPALPDSAYFDLAPDWICEVPSPATARVDRTKKLPVYAEYNVEHCWLVDPAQQTLEVLTLADRQWRIASNWAQQDRVRAAPFEEVELELGALWATD